MLSREMEENFSLDEKKTLRIYTDGASRGNPGKAACAYIYTTEDEKIIHKNGKYLGNTTNNRAEYEAVIFSLSELIDHYTEYVILSSDSKLVINQLNGDWRVNSSNIKPLYSEVLKIKEKFKDIDFNYLPRENKFISMADTLCNKILDKNIKND